MPAGIGEVARHVVDAGLQARFDFVGAQAPEAILGRAHVEAYVVLDAFGDAVQARQGGRMFGVDAERGVETIDPGLAIASCRGHLRGRACRLDGQQLVEFGTGRGGVCRGGRRKRRGEIRGRAGDVVVRRMLLAPPGPGRG